MAKRTSFNLTQLYYLEVHNVNTGRLVHEQIGRPNRITFKIHDTQPGRRKKPSLPEFYPTSMKKFEWITFHGSCKLTTLDGQNKYSEENKPFRYTTSTAWNALPGVSVYGNGVPLATRNLELEWECAAKLRSKILNSSLALSVTMAEAKTTLSWISQRTSNIAMAIQAVKKADWKSLRKTISNVSNEYKKLERGATPREMRLHSNGRMGFVPKYRSTELPKVPPTGWSTKPAAARWLEVRYAITPLLSDVDGLAKTLAEFLYDNRLELLHRWATAVDAPPDKGAELECHAARSWGGSMKGAFTWKSARVFKYSVYYTYSKWLAAFQKLQLGNAPLVAWELTPYSFVFDWLVNVGSYLELANATVGCEFISGTKSYRVAGVPQSLPIVFESNLRKTEISVGVVPDTFYRVYERSTIGSFPNFLPTVRSPLSTTHLIDALALIRVTKP